MTTQVTAEVAGTVWKLIARPGDKVSAGDTLLILESMKMEIPVFAPTDGTLETFLVTEGDPIEEDQALAQLGA